MLIRITFKNKTVITLRDEDEFHAEKGVGVYASHIDEHGWKHIFPNWFKEEEVEKVEIIYD